MKKNGRTTANDGYHFDVYSFVQNMDENESWGLRSVFVDTQNKPVTIFSIHIHSIFSQ